MTAGPTALPVLPAVASSPITRPVVRGVSPHTVCSYRDAFMLLLRFVAERRGAPGRRSRLLATPPGADAILEPSSTTLRTEHDQQRATRNASVSPPSTPSHARRGVSSGAPRALPAHPRRAPSSSGMDRARRVSRKPGEISFSPRRSFDRRNPRRPPRSRTSPRALQHGGPRPGRDPRPRGRATPARASPSLSGSAARRAARSACVHSAADSGDPPRAAPPTAAGVDPAATVQPLFRNRRGESADPFRRPATLLRKHVRDRSSAPRPTLRHKARPPPRDAAHDRCPPSSIRASTS